MAGCHRTTIKPAGEIKEDQQLYQKQLAQTIAALLGEEFASNQPVAAPVSFASASSFKK
jgi:hypothetical protein